MERFLATGQKDRPAHQIRPDKAPESYCQALLESVEEGPNVKETCEDSLEVKTRRSGAMAGLPQDKTRHNINVLLRQLGLSKRVKARIQAPHFQKPILTLAPDIRPHRKL